MIEALKAGPGAPNRVTVVDYFTKLTNPAALMPGEPLEKLPLRFVPGSREQMKALAEQIARFSNGDPAAYAFQPNYAVDDAKKPAGVKTPAQVLPKVAPEAKKAIEVPRDANLDPNSPDAPWRSFPLPFGKDAGTKLADLDKKVLYGWCVNFKVQEQWEDKDGNVRDTKPEKLAKDRKFREMLDEAAKHYEFEMPADAAQAETTPPEDDDIPF